MYYCAKCERRHRESSKIGKKHKEFAAHPFMDICEECGCLVPESNRVCWKCGAIMDERLKELTREK